MLVSLQVIHEDLKAPGFSFSAKGYYHL